jgi:hypothetical protein
MTKQARNRKKAMRFWYNKKQTPKGLIWELKSKFKEPEWKDWLTEY